MLFSLLLLWLELELELCLHTRTYYSVLGNVNGLRYFKISRPSRGLSGIATGRLILSERPVQICNSQT
jgi:hypothetical protein